MKFLNKKILKSFPAVNFCSFLFIKTLALELDPDLDPNVDLDMQLEKCFDTDPGPH